jgi:cytochrome oxidase Cu insertion factor (SCO1/SenC/PrrC family)
VGRRVLSVAACLLGIALAALAALAEAAVDAGPASAPRMEFTPVPAGTYRLEEIQSVADAVLLDEGGHPVHLSALTSGKITLLTFFYTYCADPLGCPFVHQTLTMLRNRIVQDRELSHEVRFVAISCDPTTDTPQALAQYAGQLARDSRFDWRFLTARSVSELLPVIDDFGQDVSVELDAKGRPTRALHHMLKVFLVDRYGKVREIYSLAYIHPEVMLNDMRTLYLEGRRKGGNHGQNARDSGPRRRGEAAARGA